jgi:hypothetical protein
MGWASGNYIFDPVARKARELGLADGQVTGLLAELIAQMQQADWDTEGESLDEFEDDPAIVAAFRQNGIIQECGERDGEGAATQWCERERGAIGHADGLHGDDEVTWPVAAP